MWDATFSLVITPPNPLDREMFSGSVDAGFVLALSFHHRDLEPDCVEVSMRGAYVQDKNTSVRLSAKNAGGAYICAMGGVFVGHYSMCNITIHKSKV